MESGKRKLALKEFQEVIMQDLDLCSLGWIFLIVHQNKITKKENILERVTVNMNKYFYFIQNEIKQIKL